MDVNCTTWLNYFSINKKNNLKVLLKYIKNILAKKNNNNNNIQNILIITDKWPFFWTKFINNIIFFYAHILKIEVTLLYFWKKKNIIKN